MEDIRYPTLWILFYFCTTTLVSSQYEEMNENETLPENTKPVAIDLKSMYTNIPIEEGLEAF